MTTYQNCLTTAILNRQGVFSMVFAYIQKTLEYSFNNKITQQKPHRIILKSTIN